MASDFETFWEHRSFAVVGHSVKGGFPLLTYRGLKQLGKRVFPVDVSTGEIDGERACASLELLPESVDAIVLEVPREETEDWVARAAEAGIRDVWIHQGRETAEALALAERHGLHVRSGTCAVMYVTPGFTYHSLHKWLWKLAGRY
jgi:predicted CoA-binding protein